MDPAQLAAGLLLLLLVLLGAAVVQAFMLAREEADRPPAEPSPGMVEDFIAGCISLVRRAEEEKA